MTSPGSPVRCSVGTPYYIERGRGPTLLCLHGETSAGASFERQLTGLADVCRVVAWDAPGYGASADPTGPPSLADYGNAVAEVIQRLGGEPVHLLGVGWGSAIAGQVAVEHPELVRGLVLIGGRIDPAPADCVAEHLRQLRDEGPKVFAGSGVPWMLAPGAGAEALAEAVGITEGAVRLPGCRYAVDAVAGRDLRSLLACVDVPTMVLRGEHDQVVSDQESQALHHAIPNSLHATIAGAGHLANQERPRTVNAWITAHLSLTEQLAAP